MEYTLDCLRKQIIEMSELTQSIIKASMDAQTPIEKIYERESQVNTYHKDVDDNCFKFIALKKPTARDLRLCIGIMKINSELERISDQGVSIRRYYNRVKETLPKLEQLKSLVSQMLEDAMEAFTHSHAKAATEIIKTDQKANFLHRELLQECLLGMKEGSLSVEKGFCSLWMAKNLERVGDQCTNIAEDIIFIEKGRDIRHNPEFQDKNPEATSEFDLFLTQLEPKGHS